MLESKEWHNRFKIQASWTSPVQDYLIRDIPNKHELRAIEIGCGTGAILQNLKYLFPQLYGLDINFNYLSFARSQIDPQKLICGDGYKLPFSSDSFEVVFCHYLLLWITNPIDLLEEMSRVLTKEGSLLIFAEPDYGGRIDYPPVLEKLGNAQIKSLKSQGADPFAGRKLRDYLAAAGFSEISIGVLGNEWKSNFDFESWESEWEMFEHDLSGYFSKEKLLSLKQLDLKAYKEQKRVLYVPTFFASGKKANLHRP